MKKMTTADWHHLKKTITLDGRAFINGSRVVTDNLQMATSPIDSSTLTEISFGNESHVNDAVAAARDAFTRGVWKKYSPAKKKAILNAFANLLEEHREELALLETLDTGKPITHSYHHDLSGAISCIRWYSEGIDKVYGEIPTTRDGCVALVKREPIGVVGGILPWNFPLLLLSWKIGPALALGNSIVIKPSEKTCLSTLRYAELAHQAGIPAGVFSVVPGYGHDVGQALGLHNDIDSLVFTGSTATAKQLLVAAGQSNMKRVSAETGGKSANIIFADCYDVDHAVNTAAAAVFYNQGQVCIAGTRLLIEECMYDEFMEKLLVAATLFTPTHPLESDCTMGTLIDDERTQAVNDYIEHALAQGTECLLDGRDAGHNQIGPTIFKTTPDQRIACEEIFGPVLSVMTFSSEAEAIALANDSIYGLGAGVWTSDLNRAHRMSDALQVGSVFINNYNDGDMTVPWSGFKQSGNGSDKSFHALDKFSELKTTWIDITPR